jgi:hypothetical protein
MSSGPPAASVTTAGYLISVVGPEETELEIGLGRLVAAGQSSIL